MEPGLEAYASGWRRRAEAEDAARLEQEKAVRGRLDAAVVHLVSRHGATRVCLVGSLARGTFRLGSDVDLLVWGLPENAAARAAREVSELMQVSVDLLRAEELRDDWLCYHERRGKVLYAR